MMEFLSDGFHISIACACLIPVIFLLYTKKVWKHSASRKKHIDNGNYSKCISPNCVRCQNYGQLTNQLKDKFDRLSQSIEGDLSRIQEAIDEDDEAKEKRMKQDPKQQPNTLFLPGLHPIQPLFTDNTILAQDALTISNNNQDILLEFFEIFDNLFSGDVTGWLSNSVPSGDWFVFHLYNQGVKVQENCDRCPLTTVILEKNLKRFMRGNAFGNAAFSVLQPGTHITEHFGPCNVRVRCHLGLLTPPNCWLKVNGIHQYWTQGECFLFDDSFLHEAKHSGSKSDEPRAVFIVDLWHPDISNAEMACLNKLFSLV
ncbi:aspartate beta-hydroxylase domain-containing protein 2-like [Anneissia japonica]|uniref:aspartate beta-hydroxylase domain-containing protein 2-like n=1 Tax=Anneissia japonica TaxID=1529436 RepID=UPI00142552D3|nr:aspartate beta-hydroxylase domain-containing protein 2-like [Anneissia japonica]XP_033112500.1 aspartate beta-hydroxylase domain-containing protein 2-like [Anneissia japonica]